MPKRGRRGRERPASIGRNLLSAGGLSSAENSYTTRSPDLVRSVDRCDGAVLRPVVENDHAVAGSALRHAKDDVAGVALESIQWIANDLPRGFLKRE